MSKLFVDELEKTGYPVYRQGSFLPDTPYPDDFLTFWASDANAIYYDDMPIFEWQKYTICFYSSDFESAREKAKEIRRQLQDADCICGSIIDTPSGRTSHIGYAFYSEYREETI